MFFSECWGFSVGIHFGELIPRIFFFHRHVYDLFKNLILMSTTHLGENDDDSVDSETSHFPDRKLC